MAVRRETETGRNKRHGGGGLEKEMREKWGGDTQWHQSFGPLGSAVPKFTWTFRCKIHSLTPFGLSQFELGIFICNQGLFDACKTSALTFHSNYHLLNTNLTRVIASNAVLSVLHISKKILPTILWRYDGCTCLATVPLRGGGVCFPFPWILAGSVMCVNQKGVTVLSGRFQGWTLRRDLEILPSSLAWSILKPSFKQEVWLHWGHHVVRKPRLVTWWEGGLWRSFEALDTYKWNFLDCPAHQSHQQNHPSEWPQRIILP